MIYETPPERTARRLRIPQHLLPMVKYDLRLSITPAECPSHERVRRATELGIFYRGQRDAA